MNFAFDLISDLHVETWDNFDWTGQPTAPYCVVAGDVSRDQDLLITTLKHLSQCYAGVFYIDGNDEHRWHLEDLGTSYQCIKDKIATLENVVYLQDNVVVINNTAILATNGWWSFDLDPMLEYDDCQSWYQEHTQCSQQAADAVAGLAFHDAAYLKNSIRKLQTHQEVRDIVVITHTLPASWLCNHDPDIVGSYRYNGIGNPHLEMALDEDTEQKIKVWAFGHYHRPIDCIQGPIRYVSNPRGRGDTPWCQQAYYPKRIEIAG